MASRLSSTLRLFGVRYMTSGDYGSGAGKGGGSGGSIRDAGGAFGKLEAAREEEYFRKQQREQIQQMRKLMSEEIDYHAKEIQTHKQAEQLARLHRHLEEEVNHHETVIAQHKEAIERHKKKIGQLKHEEDKAKKNYDSD